MSAPNLDVLAIRAKQAAQVLRDLKDAVRELPNDQQGFDVVGNLHAAWLLASCAQNAMEAAVRWQAKKQQPAAAGGAA